MPELRNPPADPVPWTVTRRDGSVATKVARTAWIAASMLKWSFMDCIAFIQQEPTIDRAKPHA